MPFDYRPPREGGEHAPTLIVVCGSVQVKSNLPVDGTITFVCYCESIASSFM